MNTQTKDRIIRHGQALLAAFPNASERDPIALCKKLRRVETSLERPLVGYCNGDVDADEVDAACMKALNKVRAILGITKEETDSFGLFINRDPRGYALKFQDSWVRPHNQAAEIRIHTDMGGYGILAPDLTESN